MEKVQVKTTVVKTLLEFCLMYALLYGHPVCTVITETRHMLLLLELARDANICRACGRPMLLQGPCLSVSTSDNRKYQVKGQKLIQDQPKV